MSSTAAATAVLQAAFAKTDIPDTRQTFSGDCTAHLELSKTGRTNSAETFDYSFVDLDPRRLEVKPRRGHV